MPQHHNVFLARARGRLGTEACVERREPCAGFGIGGQERLYCSALLGVGVAERGEPARSAGFIERDQLVERGLNRLPAA